MRMMDETWCGLLSCSHPACWRVQRRIRRGQARYTSPASSVSSASPRSVSELPTQKVHNIVNEAFGGSQTSLADSGFESTQSEPTLVPGQPVSRHNPLLEYLKWKRQRQQSNLPAPPQATPSEPSAKANNRRLQTLEVQEVFDLSELSPEAWEQHFTTQPYYVWMPNPDRRREVRSSSDNAEDGAVAPLPTRDITEEMLPKTLEIKSPESPQKRNAKSSLYATRVARLYRSGRPNNGLSLPDRKVASCGELRQVFGLEDKNVLSLLDLPPSILSEVLDQIEKGELITREKLGDLIRMASASAPASQHHHRSDTTRQPSVAGPDVLQQRRAKIHSDGRERNVRHPELYQTKMVYQLDDSPAGPETSTSASGLSLTRARPLPPISAVPAGSEEEQDRQRAAAVRSPAVQCVSVDAAKVSGPAARVRPFTYGREPPLDLMLAPITSPPMTQRTYTPRTDNDTASMHIEVTSDRSTLHDEVLPVPEVRQLDNRTCVTSASNETIPPSITPKIQPAGLTREESAPLDTILESGREESEEVAPPALPLSAPQHRSAAIGRVTFEEGVVTGPATRRTTSPTPSVTAAVVAAATALVEERSATFTGPAEPDEEERVSPSPSGRWSQQASPDLWPVPPASAGAADRPGSSTPTTITIPVASARQAKSAPARRLPAAGKAVPERAPATAPSAEAPLEDETPLPPPPSPEPLPATESLEPAERADSLRVHSGGPVMSPITESEDNETNRTTERQDGDENQTESEVDAIRQNAQQLLADAMANLL